MGAVLFQGDMRNTYSYDAKREREKYSEARWMIILKWILKIGDSMCVRIIWLKIVTSCGRYE
jgi:hypothetical protein